MKSITLQVQDAEGTIASVTVPEKVFSTGSRGFHKSTKITIAGKKYQCNFQLVEIGSRPATANES